MSAADPEIRERLARELDTTFVVEAAAGTGKTTALVRRIVGILSAGAARLEEIVAVTFTERAAGELQLRLREELQARAAHDAEAAPRLRVALDEADRARVSTIHGLCTDLLRRHPF